MVESPSLDLSILNLVLDNMLLTLEDFMSNIDDVAPASENNEETPVTFFQSSSSAVASKDVTRTEAGMADVMTRVSSLEQIVSEIKQTMYGDGGSEASSEIGILRHVHDLENSFNEGKQKLIGFEERLENINLKCDTFFDEVRQEKANEGENSTVMEQFQRFEEKMGAVILENDNCKQRLTCVEDQIKAVQSMDSPKATDDEVVPLKTELAQLKSKTEILDDFTRKAITDRIHVLENQPVVAFSVEFKHNGPWKKGTVLGGTNVWFNIGNAFEEEECRFVVPIDGIYGFNLGVIGNQNNITIETWISKGDGSGDGWGSCLTQIILENNEDESETMLRFHDKGDKIYLRVFGGNSYQQCLFQGWLVTPL